MFNSGSPLQNSRLQHAADVVPFTPAFGDLAILNSKIIHGGPFGVFAGRRTALVESKQGATDPAADVNNISFGSDVLNRELKIRKSNQHQACRFFHPCESPAFLGSTVVYKIGSEQLVCELELAEVEV